MTDCFDPAVVDTTNSSATWPSAEGMRLTGFSHGVAGIAYALFRLHQRTGCEPYLRMGQMAIEYERELYAPQYKN